ncbi:MAG: CoA-binding protein [Tenuifilaceae bacterium]|jgi:predicted CoA-binding protein|uniref:CoA-binding protein n=1 Tax=Perlabentimonas gracilis TaxID=2715279 RepID=UPI00140BA151|nr:CoA-binding protein [Perlabentimonas gracilis]MDX9770266.1 CoA-binding protein [Tenuifilaceae bacterium]NHB68869.1 CoA-binding protein [Perlabentimonas gracilis]
MYKDNVDVKNFLSSKSVALIGVSRNKQSYSRSLMKAFVDKGFEVFPVNPNETEIDGLKCYQSITQLPDYIDAAYIIKRKEVAVDLAREAANKGIKKIWIHVKCDAPDIKELCNEYGVTVIAGECFFMWAEPVKGVHAFHRFLRNIFS